HVPGGRTDPGLPRSFDDDAGGLHVQVFYPLRAGVWRKRRGRRDRAERRADLPDRFNLHRAEGGSASAAVASLSGGVILSASEGSASALGVSFRRIHATSTKAAAKLHPGDAFLPAQALSTAAPR